VLKNDQLRRFFARDLREENFNGSFSRATCGKKTSA
jgi:hypothetical protein